MTKSAIFLLECLYKGYISKDTALEAIGSGEKGTFWEGDNLHFAESLARIGFLTSEEAAGVNDKPTALPTEKKLLIANYVVHARYINSSALFTDDLLVRLRTACVGNVGKVKYDGPLTMEVFCDILERDETLKNALTDAYTEEVVENVSAFVCGKRRRLRAEIKKLLLACMCYELTRGPQYDEETKTEYYNAPQLLERIERDGFRPDAEVLNDTDRTALSKAADEYMNILELCYINGEGDKRLDAFETGEGVHWFADETDEVVINYSHVLGYISTLFAIALNNNTATRDDINFMDLAKVLCSVEMCDEDIVEAVRGTKYEEYLRGLETTDTLREVLPADVFGIYEAVINGEATGEPYKQVSTNKTK